MIFNQNIISQATSSKFGLIKVSSTNTSTIDVNVESAVAGRYYPVELNNNGQAIVNVPWVNSSNAATATQLANSRFFNVNLASTATASFNGTADATLGVSGILPVANGGIGANSASEGLANLGGVPTSRTINGKALLSDITIDIGDISNLQTSLNAKSNSPIGVSGTGAISITIADNRDYTYTSVTSLTMTGAVVEAHGFITFGTSTPTINVSNFTASSGDDITAAKASEIWEFSVYPHNNKSFIIWKNWSA